MKFHCFTRKLLPCLFLLCIAVSASAQVTQAVDVVAGSDNKSRLLLHNANGSTTLEVINAAGGIDFQATYGPYTGYASTVVSVGADGLCRILWVKNGNVMSFWAINTSSGAITYSPEYGPYQTPSGSQWKPVNIATGSDNYTRVQWTSSDGYCSFWTLGSNGSIAYSPVYGPYAGYTPLGIAAGYNTVRLLWLKSNGLTSFWSVPSTVSTTGTPTYSVEYTPPSGFTPTDICLDASNTSYLIFNNPSGQTNLWSFASSNKSYTPTTSRFYSLYHNWMSDRISVSNVTGSDGKIRFLWANTGDTSTLWTINSTGVVESSFDYGPTTTQNVGKHPQSALLSGAEGFLYGTTFDGGTGNHGTLFRTDISGNTKVLYTFGAQPDGIGPTAGLVRSADGSIYGTTNQGGTNGTGTVYKISPRGIVTLLHHFGVSQARVDGTTPRCRLLLDSRGVLLGTTFTGGQYDQGTVFSLNTDGTSYLIVHNFNASVEGSNPAAGIIQVAAYNNFYYGVCAGSGSGNYAYGSVFRMNYNGTIFGTLHVFTGGTDGNSPNSELAYAGATNSLYGTTTTGGGSLGFGAVYKIDGNGNFSGIHSFSNTDGINPSNGPFYVSSDGYLYGAVNAGGASGKGVLYKLNVYNNAFTSLHSFIGSDGDRPVGAGLVLGVDGYLYGTTQNGGTNSSGVVFKANVGGTVTNIHSF